MSDQDRQQRLRDDQERRRRLTTARVRRFRQRQAEQSELEQEIARRRADRLASWLKENEPDFTRLLVRLVPVGRWYVSFSHTDADVDQTIAVARTAWRQTRAAGQDHA